MAAINLIVSTSLVTIAQAYGTSYYGCGPYEQGCTDTSSGTTPNAPNTGMLLTEPSIAIPGSLLLAVLVALAIAGITKLVRRRRTHLPLR